ncbi:hypothetical protein [Fibrobacter sp.]|uniref:hypothetical protein n=1 Tax=Fibrobacter sp. TaxID=35828 RepID=UPI0038704C46
MMNKTSNNPFNTIILGFFLFNVISDVFFKLSQGSEIVIAGFKIIGLFFIFKSFFSIKNRNIYLFSPSYSNLLSLYKIICAIMIVRGYMIDYQYVWISTAGMINYHFFQPFYILCYLMPYVSYIDYRFYDYGYFMRLAYKCAKISVFLFVVAFPFLIKESSQRLLSSDSFSGNVSESSWILPYTIFNLFVFFFLLGKYQTKVERNWILGGFISVLLGGLLLGRRGRCAIMVLYSLFPIYMWIQKFRRGKFFVGLFALMCAVALTFLLFNTSLTSFITSRGTTDTRSGVDVALMDQMDSWEVVFGKGLNGRYYYPLREDDYLKGWRYGSETGFFNLILKGGLLMAFVYIALLIIPAFKGMFRSNNLLCKASGYFIFVSLLELYPFGWLMFDLKFLIIWMGVVICMNPQVRYMNDEQVYELFFERKIS